MACDPQYLSTLHSLPPLFLPYGGGQTLRPGLTRGTPTSNTSLLGTFHIPDVGQSHGFRRKHSPLLSALWSGLSSTLSHGALSLQHFLIYLSLWSHFFGAVSLETSLWCCLLGAVSLERQRHLCIERFALILLDNDRDGNVTAALLADNQRPAGAGKAHSRESS